MRTHIIFITLFLLFTNLILSAQETSDNSYLIKFKDKANSPFSLSRPSEFLSPKALERRAKNNVSLSIQDLPVNPHYVDSIRSTGAKILFTSRWFNAVTISVDTELVVKDILKFPFVRKVEKVYRGKSAGINTLVISDENPGLKEGESSYGASYGQIRMLRGNELHNNGYQGEGILIAVIDAGFFKVDRLDAFKHLYDEHRIKGVWDFVDQDSQLYDDHTHGMIVLSSMAGKMDGQLIGTAPEADYLLLRSENGSSEYRIEEDAWVAAAEYADSAGADIINSSLGYTTFDNPVMDHTYDDMDGNTTRVTRAADIAASKGILVVSSAGNEGTSSWKYISAPADGDSVLAIGAVDPTGGYVSFSSQGPSSDGRVKPNVSAQGLYTVVASTTNGEISFANGTSLSSPVLAGMAACLMQAYPEIPAMQVKEAIEMSAHLYASPTHELGYGIPDFSVAFEILRLKNKNSKERIKILELYPNPVRNQVTVSFFTKFQGTVTVTLTDHRGRLVKTEEIIVDNNSFNKVKLAFPEELQSGIYHLILSNGKEKVLEQMMKL